MKEFLELKPGEVGKECRFATYVRPPEYGMPDLHLVKEQVHLEDGTIVPRLKFVENYERPFWVTKKGYRDYKQPKEWIDKEKVNVFYSSEADLIYKASRALGKPHFRGGLRDLAKDPYLFGVDIKSTALIKKDYFDAFPDLKTEFTVGVFDTEIDVINGSNEIDMATYIFDDICFTAVKSSFLKGIANPEEEIAKKTKELLRKHADKLSGGSKEEQEIKEYLYNYVDSFKVTTVLVEQEIDVLIECFKVIHSTMPDVLAIWNIKFDIEKIQEACDRSGYPIENLMSDPSVPQSYKSFKFKVGPNQKRTSSGLITPIRPAAQWHTVKCPASFYVLDAMCVFKHTRIGQPEKRSYSLDFILNEEIKLGKLGLEATDHLGGLNWHEVMQSKYPVEYVVYNRFDCIGMILLENKVKDMKVILPQFSGTSDFEDFKSQPRRKMDALHWYVQSHDKVMGCTSESLVDEKLDGLVLSRRNWIITLTPSYVVESGLNVINENPTQSTSVYGHVGDLDVAASYPNGGATFNISKETTVRELSKIEGIDEDTFRKQNMGISAGHVNAVDYCTTMFGFPSLFELENLV
jgi:hypothetical protein